MDSCNGLSELLSQLAVPSDFAKFDSITEADAISRLEVWKDTAPKALRGLENLIEKEREVLRIFDEADIVSATASFDGQGSWITDDSRETAHVILSLWSDPNASLLQEILSRNVKPMFRSNPHPSLNLSTGRKLSRPAGGPMATMDYYESQIWKNYPGASNVVLWCVKHMKSEQYEELWHLIIPPVMTLLDDYEARYKYQGARIVREMLQRVPPRVLKRTGVDGLIRTSLNKSFGQLHDPESPGLVREAISASLSLTELTTTLGSAEYFDQLCGLLGDGIIGSVWLYASSNKEVIAATLEVLPQVVRSLGLGTTRFLKALIPQLIHPLLPQEFNPMPMEMQISSLHALDVLIHECTPRVKQWKGHILDGVCKCWVTTGNTFPGEVARDDLRRRLRFTCQGLAKACPSVVQDEYPRLLKADHDLFHDLLVWDNRDTAEIAGP